MDRSESKLSNSSKSSAMLNKLIGGVLGSVCLWTLLTLVFADVAISTLKPLKYIEDPHFLPMDKHPIVSKIPEYLERKNSPDVLVLGSSLPQIALASWDEKFARSLKWTPSGVRRYTKAVYIEKLLKEKEKSADIFNLTINAAMVSDVNLILDYAIKNDRKPEKVIYALCPRAFIANDAYPVGKSPVYKVLSNWDSFNQTLVNAKSIAEVRDGILYGFWNFYKAKADYRHVATVTASKFFDREPTLFQAQQRQKKATNEVATKRKCVANPIVNNLESHLEKDLKLYQKVYNPPNYKRFEKERKYLERLMATCKKQGIELAVINMPITRENKNILAPELYKNYMNTLASFSKKYNCLFINLDNDKEFVSSDFHDSVHLNWKGGKKVQEKLVESLTARNYL